MNNASENRTGDTVNSSAGGGQEHQAERLDAPELTVPTTSGASTLVEALMGDWRTELDGQQSISATNVQDRLLDLWGQLPEGDIRSEIEQWLTETVQRHLYAVADIDARLQRVLASA